MRVRRLREVGPEGLTSRGSTPPAGPAGLEHLLALTARGDTEAFEQVYDQLAGPILGVILQVLRDPAQSEEVAQEVLVEVWRTAGRFDPSRGSARSWALLMARRRAVDRVRSAQAGTDREGRLAAASTVVEYDEVAETVETRWEQQQVRRCLGGLTELQQESLTLAFYRGYTQREVADVLGVPLGTVKTRLRDGLIRLRDCVGVA